MPRFVWAAANPVSGPSTIWPVTGVTKGVGAFPVRAAGSTLGTARAKLDIGTSARDPRSPDRGDESAPLRTDEGKVTRILPPPFSRLLRGPVRAPRCELNIVNYLLFYAKE